MTFKRHLSFLKVVTVTVRVALWIIVTLTGEKKQTKHRVVGLFCLAETLI